MIRILLLSLLVTACSPATCPTIQQHVARTPSKMLDYHHELSIEPARMKLVREQRAREALGYSSPCMQGDDGACMQLARGSEFAMATGVIAGTRRRCLAGDHNACRLLDPDDRPGYERPCSSTPEACTQRLEADCSHGIPQACDELGHHRQDPMLLRRASQLAQAGCAAGLDHECKLLDRMNLTLRDQVLAWSRGCQRAGRWCSRVAQTLLSSGDAIGARYHLEVACQLLFECHELLLVYRTKRVPELYPGRLAEVEAVVCGRACRQGVGGLPTGGTP